MIDFFIRLFIKGKQTGTNSRIRERYGKFAGITGIVTNLFLFLIKIAAGFLFNSIAITADAVNNLSDSGSSIITYLGFRISGKPADERHPYGHARMEYVAGLVISMTILFLGLQLIKVSIEKVITPQTAEFSIISVIVLLIAILVKIWQCLFYRRIAGIIRSDTIFATSADSLNDIFATSAVLISIVVTYITGFNLDGYMGIMVALIIMLSGIRLVMKTINPLIGVAPTREFVDSIYKKILSYDRIIGLHDLTVHSYGSGRYFASVHCEVPAEQDILVSHDIIDNIERDFLKDQGIHMVIHLDPVITNDEKTNKLKEILQIEAKNIDEQISIHDFRAVWGITHSNLIFDIVIPFGTEMDDEEVISILTDKVQQLDPDYYAVITVDHEYSPNIDK